MRSALVQAVSLAEWAMTAAHGWAANSWNARIRLKAESDRHRTEISLLREEVRIKDARMALIPALHRPHYAPMERLAILELRAARGWSVAQAARVFLVTPATISSWTMRLDEQGAGALVRTSRPVNTFPDFIGYLVRRLKTLCPSMGKVKIARILARAGLHLAPTTVPTALGFWTAWFPFALPQRWPFCWWLVVVVDHFSRRIMALAAYSRQPSSRAIRSELGRSFRKEGRRPRHLISNHGGQFIARAFKQWCLRQDIRPRLGAVGRYGSLAVIERCIRTLKTECTRRLIAIPLRLGLFERELSFYRAWYNRHRPHTALGGRTPDEMYQSLRPACRTPRFEPRSRWPRRSRCAAPRTLIRGRTGVHLQLDVRFLAGRQHLPIVSLKRAA